MYLNYIKTDRIIQNKTHSSIEDAYYNLIIERLRHCRCSFEEESGYTCLFDYKENQYLFKGDIRIKDNAIWFLEDRWYYRKAVHNHYNRIDFVLKLNKEDSKEIDEIKKMLEDLTKDKEEPLSIKEKAMIFMQEVLDNKYPVDHLVIRRSPCEELVTEGTLSILLFDDQDRVIKDLGLMITESSLQFAFKDIGRLKDDYDKYTEVAIKSNSSDSDKYMELRAKVCNLFKQF